MANTLLDVTTHISLRLLFFLVCFVLLYFTLVHPLRAKRAHYQWERSNITYMLLVVL